MNNERPPMLSGVINNPRNLTAWWPGLRETQRLWRFSWFLAVERKLLSIIILTESSDDY